MIDEIRNFGKQFGLALQVARDVDFSRFDNNLNEIENIYLCGMGGSSLPGDIVNTVLRDEVEVKFVRDYDIPKKDNYSKDIYILASFSGNTEEVLSCLEQVEKVTDKLVIMANGGKLKQIAEEKNYIFLEVPECKQPRIASGYFFAFWLVILSQLGKIDLDWFDKLNKLENFLGWEISNLESQWKDMAKKLYQYLPIIYADRSLKAMARIAKIDFNENSKIQAFWNEVPELNHNEFVGFTKLITKPYVILLKSKFMHHRNRKRMEIMEKVLWSKVSFLDIEAKWDNLLQEFFWCYCLFGFVSYYLAFEYGIDPMPVDMVEDFKKLLK